MSRFDLLQAVKNAKLKDKSLFASPTTGVSGRLTANGHFVNDFAPSAPRPLADPKATAKEADPLRDRLRAEAQARNAAFLKETYGVDIAAGFESRTSEELAELIQTCASWAQEAQQNGSEFFAPLLADVTQLYQAVPGVLGFKLCRSLMRQSIGSLVRATGVAPGMAAKLAVMEVRGAARDHEEQMKRDKLLEASSEAVEAARPMLALADAISFLGETQGFVDHQGRSASLEAFDELCAATVELELRSRKGKARYQLGVGTPALSDAIKEIEAEGPALMKAVMEFMDVSPEEEGPHDPGEGIGSVASDPDRAPAIARAEHVRVQENLEQYLAREAARQFMVGFITMNCQGWAQAAYTAAKRGQKTAMAEEVLTGWLGVAQQLDRPVPLTQVQKDLEAQKNKEEQAGWKKWFADRDAPNTK